MPDATRLRFADWMARALHDPQDGYYARNVPTVGRRGDFSTAAGTGTVLGEAVAQWLHDELATQHGLHTVIEAGGGDGSLSAAVRKSLGWWRRRSLHWIMVETSAPLQAQQQSTLGAQGVRWFAKMEEALDACAGHALIFHNELLDAFPVTLLQWDAAAAQWLEVCLTKADGAWQESLAPHALHPPEQRRYGSLQPSAWSTVPLRDGQRIELGTVARAWLAGWAPHWKAGAMLTLDYGGAFPQLYHRQPRGTLRAYLRHQRLTGADVYANMGRQDITADVNFTDLAAWAEELGWTVSPLLTQRAFLQQHVGHLEARLPHDPAAAFLVDEQGAGSAFKALVVRRAAA